MTLLPDQSTMLTSTNILSKVSYTAETHSGKSSGHMFACFNVNCRKYQGNGQVLDLAARDNQSWLQVTCCHACKVRFPTLKGHLLSSMQQVLQSFIVFTVESSTSHRHACVRNHWAQAIMQVRELMLCSHPNTHRKLHSRASSHLGS